MANIDLTQMEVRGLIQALANGLSDAMFKSGATKKAIMERMARLMKLVEMLDD